MKWMRRKRPESDVIPEQDKSSNAFAPFVNWPFVKGTSVDERKNENILDRVRRVVT